MPRPKGERASARDRPRAPDRSQRLRLPFQQQGVKNPGRARASPFPCCSRKSADWLETGCPSWPLCWVGARTCACRVVFWLASGPGLRSARACLWMPQIPGMLEADPAVVSRPGRRTRQRSHAARWGKSRAADGVVEATLLRSQQPQTAGEAPHSCGCPRGLIGSRQNGRGKRRLRG